MDDPTTTTTAPTGGDGSQTTITPTGTDGSQTTTQSGGGEPQPFVDAQGNLSDDWYTKLDSEEIKNAPALKNFKSMEGLVKSFLSAQRMIGNSPHSVIIPDETATEEERAEFLNKLGRPEDPNGYEIKKPENLEEIGLEWNDDSAKAFANVAHEVGLTKEQFNKIMDWHNNMTIESFKNADSSLEQEYEQARQTLQKEWGNAYESNVKLVSKLVDKLGITEVVQNKGLANDPVFIKAMNELARKTSEDQFIEGDINNTPANAIQEINEIMGNPKHPYHIADHPSHGDAVNKMQSLYRMAHPEPN